jgi:outer membrane protein assembly factor BamB
MHPSHSFVSILIVGLSASVLSAQAPSDWPQFRGPGGQGVSPDKGVPTTWGPKDNLLWKIDLPGPGTGSPIVIGDKIFLTCHTGYAVPGKARGDIKDLRLHLLCLDRQTGKELWNKDVDANLPKEQERIREDHGYASGTPAADAEHVYVCFGKAGVVAFDHSGQQKWKKEIGEKVNGWGTAVSPVLVGDLVVVNASVESESVIAFNRKSGEQVWRKTGVKESWSTPVVVTAPGGRRELVVAMFGKVLGLDPATGKDLWSCATDITWYMVPGPVAEDGVVYCLGGRSGVAALAVKAGGEGNVTATHRLWTEKKGSNVSSPVVHDGHLYWMNDNTGTAYCAEGKTGKIVYEQRIDRAGQVYASPVLVDGKIYYTSRDGKTFVVAAKPEFELLATNTLGTRGEMFNASPAVAGGRLFVRSNLALYCVGK